MFWSKNGSPTPLVKIVWSKNGSPTPLVKIVWSKNGSPTPLIKIVSLLFVKMWYMVDCDFSVNKIKMRSFKCSKHINEKRGMGNTAVSASQASSVALGAKRNTVILQLSIR